MADVKIATGTSMCVQPGYAASEDKIIVKIAVIKLKVKFSLNFLNKMVFTRSHLMYIILCYLFIYLFIYLYVSSFLYYRVALQ